MSDSSTSTTFDGSSGYVSAPVSGSLDVLASSSAISVEAWVNAAGFAYTGLNPRLVSNTDNSGNSFVLGSATTLNPASIGFEVNGAGNSSIGVIGTGGWHHIVGTWNNGSFAIYIDGMSQALGPPEGFITSPSSTLYIASSNGTQGYLNGELADVTIYNYALTPSQVYAHYNVGISASLTCQSVLALPNNAWTFVGGIYDGSTSKLFINGRQNCSLFYGLALTPPSTNLVAGATATNTKNWSGSIADLKLYGTSDSSTVGSAGDLMTAFNATADSYRTYPLATSSLVTNGLVLNLDAALGNGVGFPGSGCSQSSWFESIFVRFGRAAGRIYFMWNLRMAGKWDRIESLCC